MPSSGPRSRSTIPDDVVQAIQRPRLTPSQQLLQRLAQLRWAWATRDSSRFHRRDLALGIALAARDDRAGMAHAAARRRGAAGDEADDRLLAPALRLVGEELGGFFLGEPPISPIMMIDLVSSSARNISSTSMNSVPLTGSPPMPTAVVWPRPSLVVWNTAS